MSLYIFLATLYTLGMYGMVRYAAEREQRFPLTLQVPHDFLLAALYVVVLIAWGAYLGV
jgi:hypothetical protein